MDSVLRKRKIAIIVVLALIAIILAVTLGPTLVSRFMGPGIKTEGIDASGAKPTEMDANGEWEVYAGSGPNATSAGFTFDEILPSDARSTSGSTTDVTGSATVENGHLIEGHATVNLTDLHSDSNVRDQNVRTKLLETDTYPTAEFTITGSTDLTGLPRSGEVGSVQVPGELTIKGVTKHVNVDLDVLATGDHVVVAGDIPIRREDYGVRTPDFIAAKIAEEGEVNIRLMLKEAS